jgi:hypothetical protein
MTNEGAEQEYEVLIRCTHNDKKFASRVSLISQFPRIHCLERIRDKWMEGHTIYTSAYNVDTALDFIDIYPNLLYSPESIHGSIYA